MLNSVHITNFESHAHTQVDFSPGVNVVVGLSDMGKSALFRAIQWALFNRPAGDAFIRRGTRNASVSVILDDGDDTHLVERSKGKSVNHYGLDDQTFEAFGQDVPDEIRRAINMDRGTNVQGQMDPMFLLQSSAGEVARHLNDVAGLDEIDQSLSYLQSQQRRATNDHKRAAASLESLNADLDAYEYLDAIAAELSECEDWQQDLDRLYNERERLKRAVDTAQQARSRIAAARPAAEAKDELTAAEKAHKRLVERRQVRQRLDRAVRLYRSCEAHCASLRTALAHAEPLESMTAKLGKLYNERDRLAETVERARKIETRVSRAHERQQQLEQQWGRDAPHVCPLCNGTGKLRPED